MRPYFRQKTSCTLPSSTWRNPVKASRRPSIKSAALRTSNFCLRSSGALRTTGPNRRLSSPSILSATAFRASALTSACLRPPLPSRTSAPYWRATSFRALSRSCCCSAVRSSLSTRVRGISCSMPDPFRRYALVQSSRERLEARDLITPSSSAAFSSSSFITTRA